MAAAIAIVVAQAFRPALAFAQDARPSFSEWLAGVRSEAIARGVKTEIVDAALAGVEEPLPVILERDRAQAETVFSLEHYVARRLTPKLIASGREAYARHRELLDEVGTAYDVPPRIIAAIWGIESNYGRFTGVRPTVSALATLAWDPRRATFFRGELFNALEILNRGDIDLAHLKGSWAGAMGQVQFMPSSYLQYAEDYDGDGRRDIWATPSDIFASIANYLSGRGWTLDAPWGREVKVSPDVAQRIRSDVAPRSGSCQATRNMTVALPIAKWEELGVRMTGGRPLPKSDVPASLVAGSTRYFLVTPNYDAILDYNCSHSYAITVGLLGDAIASTGKIAATPAPPSKSKAKASHRKKG
ncbi:MAG TPA: lytic murein transglycosylase [Vicinamibacterales bacterium]|nr:lytic murein transglycosylase [Vicinamibacterales bacterium]